MTTKRKRDSQTGSNPKSKKLNMATKTMRVKKPIGRTLGILPPSPSPLSKTPEIDELNSKQMQVTMQNKKAQEAIANASKRIKYWGENFDQHDINDFRNDLINHQETKALNDFDTHVIKQIQLSENINPKDVNRAKTIYFEALKYARDSDFKTIIDQHASPDSVSYNIKKMKKGKEHEMFSKIGIISSITPKSMLDIRVISVDDEVFKKGVSKSHKNKFVDALKSAAVDNELIPEDITGLIHPDLQAYNPNQNITAAFLQDMFTVQADVRSEIKEGVKLFESSTEKNKLDVSEIPIYMVVLVGGVKNAIHMSIVVILGNQQYSIGLGYIGITEKQQKMNERANRLGIPDAFFHLAESSLYSPDYMIDLDDNKTNKVIGAGILTSAHINKLSEFAKEYNKLTCEYITYVDPNNNVDEEGNREIRLLTQGKFFYSGSKREYSATCTKGLKGYSNCTTYVEDIFPNINCGMFFGKGIVHPRNCKSNPPLAPEKLRKIYAFMLNGNTEELLKLL